MKDIKWIEGNRIQITPPKRTKKITGTRFASILGLNPWSTEFEMWCAITKTYEEPFEDTIYTIAGKTIEPKQAAYMERSYGMDLLSPTDVYGENYFDKTHGDFFPDNKICGGMWDYLETDGGTVTGVLEMKTTKRIEDWQDDVPEYYALQAALYAWLLGVDDVTMVASFLSEKDYDDPGKYKPSVKNTVAIPFKVSERYPDFADKVEYVADWWVRHVKTGISPAYDEKKDADILKALRTTSLSPETDIQALIKEAETIKTELDRLEGETDGMYKRLDEINGIIKDYAKEQFKDGDTKVEVKGSMYTWSITKSSSMSIDKAALKADGLLDKYQKATESYRLSVKRDK